MPSSRGGPPIRLSKGKGLEVILEIDFGPFSHWTPPLRRTQANNRPNRFEAYQATESF